jgi:hypothetical protein
MGMMLDAREERIKAKAHALWEADGKPDGRDREHWEQAARLVEEEERAAAREGEGNSTDGNDPVGITLAAMKRP